MEKKILTREDIDANPLLIDLGLKEGDGVEFDLEEFASMFPPDRVAKDEELLSRLKAEYGKSEPHAHITHPRFLGAGFEAPSESPSDSTNNQ